MPDDEDYSHDPTQPEIQCILATRDAGPRTTMLRARYRLGEGIAAFAMRHLNASALRAYTNLRKLRDNGTLDRDEWKKLDMLRDEGNKACHAAEVEGLESKESLDYERRVDTAIDEVF